MSEKIVQLNEEVIKGQIKELVRGSVEETLNELLEKEAESLTQAARYERNEARQGYRSGHYDRNLTTTSGDDALHDCKKDCFSFGQLPQLAEVRVIIVRSDNKVVRVDRTELSAWSQLELVIVPVGHNGQFESKRRNGEISDVVVSVNGNYRHFRYRRGRRSIPRLRIMFSRQRGVCKYLRLHAAEHAVRRPPARTAPPQRKPPQLSGAWAHPPRHAHARHGRCRQAQARTR